MRQPVTTRLELSTSRRQKNETFDTNKNKGEYPNNISLQQKSQAKKGRTLKIQFKKRK